MQTICMKNNYLKIIIIFIIIICFLSIIIIIILLLLVVLVILILWEFFTPSISWWFFTGIWETANFLKSPGLFSVFWQILKMLQSEWAPFVFLFPKSSNPFYQSFDDCSKHTNYNCLYGHLLVPLFFQFSSKVRVLISLFVFFWFYSKIFQTAR